MDILPKYYGHHNMIRPAPVYVYLEFNDGLSKYLSSIYRIHDVCLSTIRCI